MDNRYKFKTLSLATFPSTEFSIDIDFLVFSIKMEQNRVMSRIDIEPMKLDNNEFNSIVGLIYSVISKTTTIRPLGNPTKIPNEFPVD